MATDGTDGADGLGSPGTAGPGFDRRSNRGNRLDNAAAQRSAASQVDNLVKNHVEIGKRQA